jgi:hypothetical protein
MPPAPIPNTPPAYVPADVLHHLNVVKTNSPNLTLEDTIDSIWSAIKEHKNLCAKHKKSVVKIATDLLDRPLQLLKRKPDAPLPKASHTKKIKNSDTTTKPPTISNRKLNYQRLLKMERAPRSLPNLIQKWDPSLIQGIDLLKARYSGVNVLEEMLMLIELFGMYCVLDPIDGKVASCAIVERNHFRESFDTEEPDNATTKYKEQASFYCWIVHYHSAHSATLLQLLQQVGTDIQTENELVVGSKTSYIYINQPTGTTSYTLNPVDNGNLQQEYESYKSYGFTNTEDQLQAWVVTNSRFSNAKRNFTARYLPCTIANFRRHCICAPSRHTIKKMFPGNLTEIAVFPKSFVKGPLNPYKEDRDRVYLLDPYFGWKRSDWYNDLKSSAMLKKDVKTMMKTSNAQQRVQVMRISHAGAATVASLDRSCVWRASCKLVSLVNKKKGRKMLDAYNDNPLEYQDLRVMSGHKITLRAKLMEEYQVQLEYLKKDGKKVSRTDVSEVLLDGSINTGFYLCTLVVGKSLQGGASHAIGIDMRRKLIYAPDLDEPLPLTARSLSICMDDSTEIVVTMAVKLVHVYHTV